MIQHRHWNLPVEADNIGVTTLTTTDDEDDDDDDDMIETMENTIFSIRFFVATSQSNRWRETFLVSIQKMTCKTQRGIFVCRS
jgi:hypothetical protein